MTTEQLMTEERLLSLEEAARIAGCSTEAMRCRVKRYGIPTQRSVARRVYIRLGDLMTHLKQRS